MEEASIREETVEDLKNDNAAIEAFFGEAVGMSFDSNDNDCDQNTTVNSSSDSSDFQIADDSDLSSKVMLAIRQRMAVENESSDQYNFTDNEKSLQKDEPKSFDIRDGFCCNIFCSSQNVTAQFKSKMKELLEKPKTARKQYLLDHLIKQEELGIPTDGFRFFGFYICKKALVILSGVSDYLIEEACKAFENGQSVFSHGNQIGMRDTEASTGFVIWMKQHAINYGNQAPDEESIILPACFSQKDVFDQYVSEVPEPKIKQSTFYRLFKVVLNLFLGLVNKFEMIRS